MRGGWQWLVQTAGRNQEEEGGESGCLGSISCVYCMYVGQTDSQDNVCEWLSEWGMNDRHVLLGMCVCLESVALCLLHVLSATLLLFCLPFLTCFGRFPAIVCMYAFIWDVYFLLCLFILFLSISKLSAVLLSAHVFPLGILHLCVCVCVCV